MNILGWVLAVVGLAFVIFALRMMLKAKKMSTVPFRKPSEIAAQGPAVADAKGMLSTEGQAVTAAQPLIAPMSGQPCIGYELTVERKWEKQVRTEKGIERKTGSTQAHKEWRGSLFQITDGTSAVLIDCTTEPDSEYEKSHSSTVSVGNMIPGSLKFGAMQMNTPSFMDHDSRTTAFVGTEKILKASPTMYALGQFAQGPQGFALGTPKGMTTGKLIVHHQGRAKLMGKTKRNMILGYALGGVTMIGGVCLGLLGPKLQSTSCPETIAGDVSCSDRMFAADGKDFQWNVKEAATYSITIVQPPGAYAIDGVIEVFGPGGKQAAYNDGGSADKNAVITQTFQPGQYRINVRDFGHTKAEGGYGFKLVVKRMGAATEPSAVASAAASASAPALNAPTHPGAAAHGQASLTPHPGAAHAGAGAAATTPSAKPATPPKKP